MKFKDIYDEFLQTFNLADDLVDDYRPFDPSFVGWTEPKAIVVWMKNGSKVVYFHK